MTSGPGDGRRGPDAETGAYAGDGGAPRGRTLVIGLTGPIGCGKSTVASWLAEVGAQVIDADQVAREVVEPGEPALAAIVEAFGADVLRGDGRLDRAALARVAFGDPVALRRLEGIIRPAVRPRIRARIASAVAAGAPIVVLEAIGLVEGGYVRDCDEVWLVSCPPEAQAERLRGRGVPDDDAARRVAAQQAALPAMLRAATRRIDTAGTPDEARARVSQALAAALARRAGA